MGIFSKRPALRWFAPLALVLVVGGTGLVATSATANPTLPPKSAEQLLVDLQNARVDGLSGTVVHQANLGIPALPTSESADTEELTSLLSGKHTLRVWYAGPDKARLALLNTFGETDLVVSGRNVWTWSSDSKEATHRTLPEAAEEPQRRTPPSTSDVPKTPEEAAQRALEAVGESTLVTADASVTVANRPAYELVLSPRDNRSLVGQVRIALDAETSVPLRVQMLTVPGDTVFDIGYTDVSFAVPDAGRFEFNPPEGSTVTEAAPPERKAPTEAERKAAEEHAEELESRTKVVGESWTAVVVTDLGEDAVKSDQLATMVDALEKVSGPWGQGRQLSGTAFTAVLTDDGRLAVGAVGPELIYQALEK